MFNNKQWDLMRKAAYLLIAAGLMVMLYPTFIHWAEDKKQQELIQSWEALNASALHTAAPAETDSEATKPQPAVNVANTSTLPTALALAVPQAAPAAITSAPAPAAASAAISAGRVSRVSAAPPLKQPKVIALLKIDAINLKLPVVEGVRQEDIKNAPGHIPGTALPGEIGNAVIAGHRSYSYSRMFNRLEQLEPGHTVLVQAGGHDYEYTIYQKKMVEPSDMSVLNRNNKDKILTLITCDESGKQRFILQAKLK